MGSLGPGSATQYFLIPYPTVLNVIVQCAGWSLQQQQQQSSPEPVPAVLAQNRFCIPRWPASAAATLWRLGF